MRSYRPWGNRTAHYGLRLGVAAYRLAARMKPRNCASNLRGLTDSSEWWIWWVHGPARSSLFFRDRTCLQRAGTDIRVSGEARWLSGTDSRTRGKWWSSTTGAAMRRPPSSANGQRGTRDSAWKGYRTAARHAVGPGDLTPGRRAGFPVQPPTCCGTSARSSGRTSSSTARSRSTPPSSRCAALRTLA